jgi:SAM-dependent methyltransferase
MCNERRVMTTITPSRIKTALTSLAGCFPSKVRETILYENGGKHIHEVSRLIATCPPPARVIDIGGGVGVNLLLLRHLGLDYELHLFDRFEEYTAENRMGSADHALALLHEHEIRVVNQDLWRQPVTKFADGSFDIVTCYDVIEHLPGNPLALMREMLRLLRPGGTVIIGVPNAVSTMKRIKLLLGTHPYIPFDLWVQDAYYDHYREYTAPECRRLLEMVGFREIKTEMNPEPAATRARNGYWRRLHYGLHPRDLAVRTALRFNYLVDWLVPGLRASIYCYGQV